MSYHIITKPGCGHCVRAKQMLDIRGLAYTIDHRDTPEGVLAFINEGHRTFPRVFLDGVLIGGATELDAYLKGLEPEADDF